MSKHRHEECCCTGGYGMMGGYGYGAMGGYGGGYGAGYGGYGGWSRWIYALLILIVIVLQFGRRKRFCEGVRSIDGCVDGTTCDGGSGFLGLGNACCDNQEIDNSVLFIIIIFLLVICAGCWGGGGFGGGYGYY